MAQTNGGRGSGSPHFVEPIEDDSTISETAKRTDSGGIPKPGGLPRRSFLKLGVTGLVVTGGLSMNARLVRGQSDPTNPKVLASQWQTAFNEGDIDTLRSLYSESPQVSLVPVGETPPDIDIVLSFNRLAEKRGVTIEISIDELTETGSAPVQYEGPATLDTMPMGSFTGEAVLQFEETDGTLQIANLRVDIPFEVLLDSWGEPGELPADAAPLTDMEPGETFQGMEGGLYGNYQNVPPLSHQQAAVHALEQIQPRGPNGNPSEDGAIGLITLGPSNTWHYSDAFERMVRETATVNSKLLTFNGCEGTFSGDARSWSLGDYPAELLNFRLQKAGFTPAQIQVAWYTPHYYHDMRKPIDAVGYAEDIHAYVLEMLPKVKAHFPNLEIVYLSGFPYLGYAKTGFGEPMSYGMNLAARSLIRAQIDGDPTVNYDPEQGDERVPLLLWGPYLWAKGETPRDDGLSWAPEDFSEADGAHASEQGARKVADLLLEFFETNQFARSWFLGTDPPAIDDLEAPTTVPTETPTDTTTGAAPGLGLGAGIAGIGAGAAYRFYRDRER